MTADVGGAPRPEATRPVPTGPPATGPGPLDWAGVVLLCACAALAALLELAFIPLYAGSIVVPVVVAGALVGNVVLPMMARGLVGSTAGALVPFLTWLVVVLIFGVLFPRPEGDVLLPGGSLTWVSYGVLLGGTLAGTLTIVLGSTPRAPINR